MRSIEPRNPCATPVLGDPDAVAVAASTTTQARLEASLTSGCDARRRLLDALLNEALLPINERDAA